MTKLPTPAKFGLIAVAIVIVMVAGWLEGNR